MLIGGARLARSVRAFLEALPAFCAGQAIAALRAALGGARRGRRARRLTLAGLCESSAAQGERHHAAQGERSFHRVFLANDCSIWRALSHERSFGSSSATSFCTSLPISLRSWPRNFGAAIRCRRS